MSESRIISFPNRMAGAESGNHGYLALSSPLFGAATAADRSNSSEVVKTLPSLPLASWGRKPVPKRSAGGKEVFLLLQYWLADARSGALFCPVPSLLS